MADTMIKNSPLGNRWAILAIYAGFAVGVVSAVICLKWYLVIFGFNIMYIVSPLLAGFVENYVAQKKHGKTTGAISALLTFILINLYGWILPGWIFPKEPVTLSLITIIAIILTIQAAFPIFVNHLLLVILPGIAARIMGLLVRTPAEIIQATTPEGEIAKQADEFFLDELTMPLVSVPDVNSEKIVRYVGLVVGEAIAEEKASEGRFSSITKIIQPAQLENYNLGDAKKVAFSRMLENAQSMGANGVVEVLIDFVSMGGLQGSATIVTATGTAVIFERDNDSDKDKSQRGGKSQGSESESQDSEYASPEGEGASQEGKDTSKEDYGAEIDINISKDSQKVLDDENMVNESMKRESGRIRTKISDEERADDFYREVNQFVRDEKNKLNRNLELATKNYMDEDLEKRFINVSQDLDKLGKVKNNDQVNDKVNNKKRKRHRIITNE